jgi:hypothetical protein
MKAYLLHWIINMLNSFQELTGTIRSIVIVEAHTFLWYILKAVSGTLVLAMDLFVYPRCHGHQTTLHGVCELVFTIAPRLARHT